MVLFLLTMVGCSTTREVVKTEKLSRSVQYIECVSRLNNEGMKAEIVLRACGDAYKRN